MKRFSSSIAFLFLFLAPSASGLASTADTSTGKVTFDSVYSVLVHKSLPAYHIRLIERTVPQDTAPGATYWAYELDIQPSGSAQLMQKISAYSDANFELQSQEEFPGIAFTDLNFDGYTDIKMFNGRAANGSNASFAVYLFNRQTHQFVYHEQFSEIVAGSYLEIDPHKKEITSFGTMGCLGDCWSKDTYKVQGDSLILIHSLTQSEEFDDPDHFVVVERELINGVLTVISKKVIPPPRGPDR